MNGVNRVVHELATQQHRAGFSVEVWGFTANPVHDYPARVYTTRLFAAGRNPFALSRFWKQAMLNRRDRVVVQFHGGFVPRFYAAARFLQQLQIPYLVTPHGNYNWHALKRNLLRKKLYFNLFEQAMLAGAGAVHALGQSEIDGLQRLFPNQKSVLIPYGYTAPATPMADSSSGFIVGFCGRLDIDHKGLDRLLEGFALLRQPAAQLWLIGDGPHRQALETLAGQLQIGQQVTFWGGQFGDEKLRLLRQCSVFVHASRYEGLPVAVLEAAALGIPCLVSEATNVGAAVRTFEAGYVMQRGTAMQVADGLTVLHQQWQHDHLTTLRQNARRMVDEGFNWSNQLDSFDQLYRLLWQPN